MTRAAQQLAATATCAALCGAAAALAAPSCAAILGMEEPEPFAAAGGGGAAAAGGQGGSAGAGGAGGSECEHARWPDPPDGGTENGTLDFVVAVRSIRSEDAMGDAAGFDQDNLCTCQGQGSSCLAPSSLPGVDDCDWPGGRDNNFVTFAGLMGALLGLSDLFAYYSGRAEVGEWSLLMRVQDYNGEPTDRRVRLSWYVTTGSMAQPGWAGNDGWHVSAASLDAGPDGGPDLDSPLFVDPHAWVVDSVLVASLPRVDLIFGSNANQLIFRLTTSIVTAELSEEEGMWQMTNGVIAGRVAVADLFYMLSNYRETAGQLICRDHAAYDTIRDLMCALPDILTEFGPTTRPCDAVSVGIGFEAEQARLGDIAPPPDAGPGCPPETDPANDSCPPWW